MENKDFNNRWKEFITAFYKSFDSQENQKIIQKYIDKNYSGDPLIAYEHVYQQQREDNLIKNAVFYFCLKDNQKVKNFNKAWLEFIETFNANFEKNSKQGELKRFARINSPSEKEYPIVYEHIYQQQRTDSLLKAAILEFIHE